MCGSVVRPLEVVSKFLHTWRCVPFVPRSVGLFHDSARVHHSPQIVWVAVTSVAGKILVATIQLPLYLLFDNIYISTSLELNLSPLFMSLKNLLPIDSS